MHIDRFLAYIEKEKRYSEHTVLAYKNDLTEFEDFSVRYFEVPIQNSDHKVVRTWFAGLMEDDIAPRTIRRKASSLKSFYKFLRKSGVIQNDPMRLVPLPKMEKKLPEFIEVNKISDLFDPKLFGESFEGRRDRLILDLFYQTGIRRSELIELELKNVDLVAGTIKVLGKRNKERIIPISQGLIETIEEYLTYRTFTTVNNLFVTDKGNKLYPKLVYNIVNNHLAKVTTLSKKSPHILRHSFATHMLNNGAELNTIKELLGHASLSATQVYTHNSIDQLKSIYKQAHPRA